MNKVILSLMTILMATSVLNAGAGAGAGASSGSSSDAPTKHRLRQIPDTALGGIAGYLDPKSALALRATDRSLRVALPSNKVMANDCIDKMVSGGTPNPRVVEGLGALEPAARQTLLRASLIEKFGGGKVFTIRNTSVFPEDIAAVCQRVYVGADPIIQQHNKEYFIRSISTDVDRDRQIELQRSIEGQYRTLIDVLAPSTHVRPTPEELRVPTYLTATQEELGTNLAAANTYFAAHPGVTLVLQAAAGNPTLSLGIADLPASLRKLSVVGDHVTTIGERFLGGCRGLTAIDFSGLSNVTTIGGRFLGGCRELTAIDLSGLSNVTTIGGGFLMACSGLTTIDLSPLRNLSTIGGFLWMCTGLTTIDLSPLRNLTSIGTNVLAGCTGLTTINLSALSNVRTIGDQFLDGCRRLTTIDLSSLRNVTSIGSGFLDGCSRLTIETEDAAAHLQLRTGKGL